MQSEKKIVYAQILQKYNKSYNLSIYRRAHMKLTIKNLSAGDFGNYRCVSKNSLGETEGSIRVYGNIIEFHE